MATTERMPVLFVGHGSPMNAIEDNPWSRGFASLRGVVPRPTAILAVSAHWYLDGTFLTAEAQPRTIHDFGGFPPALHAVEYPAPGRAELASRVRALLGEARADLRTDWGLDHGTWSVLCRMYPDADVPVVQLSIDRRLAPAAHLELARDLLALRHEGVLILGSGNLTHNLRDAFGRMRAGASETPDWARRFDALVASALEQHDDATIVAAGQTDDGRMSHPTPDHWLPLIYALGATDRDDAVTYPIEGFDAGSLSMRAVRWG